MRMASLLQREQAPEAPALTLATLFDDVIDAEHVLTQLRRSQQPPDTTSVILREQVLRENDEMNPYRAVLSEVVARSSLEAASKWLEGLASLILPDRAQYLSAGPVGQILSTIQDTMQSIENDPDPDLPDRFEIRQLSQTLQLFGFSRDEARYMEQRIVVGSPFIAITTTDTSQLRSVHRMLSKSMPVYVGLAKTDAAVFRRAQSLLETGPRDLGTVVIADAISPLDYVSSTLELHGTHRDLRGNMLHSRYGEMIGRIDDLVFEPNPAERINPDLHGALSDQQFVLRYVIVRPNRKPGMNRKAIALPGDRVSMQSGALIANVTFEELVRAPRMDQTSTMSRQDEAAIRRHFQAPFYWIGDSTS